jgi:hypothetical protein
MIAMENPSPQAAQVRATRHLLRQVDAHLRARWEQAGAMHESIGMVDIFWQPGSLRSMEAIALPRRNTALVPPGDFQRGLHRLMEIGCPFPSASYIEGLFPTHYADQLRSAGMVVDLCLPLALLPLESSNNKDTSVTTIVPVETQPGEDWIGSAQLLLAAGVARVCDLKWPGDYRLGLLLDRLIEKASQAQASLLVISGEFVGVGVRDWVEMLDKRLFIVEGSLNRFRLLG